MRLLKQFAQFLVVAVVGFGGERVVAVSTHLPWLALVIGLAAAVLTQIAYRWIVRVTEHRDSTELALAPAAGGIVRGTLAGAGLFAAVIGVMALLGGYRVDGAGAFTDMVVQFGVMAAAAVTEELLIRGILFRAFEERFGTWIALVASGLIFGLLHLTNPDATLWGALAIAIEAGGMLAAAFVATRTLWLAIGVHFGWNLAEGGIFGTEVSGSGAPTGVLHGVTSGPTLLTGGEFGPEASLLSIIAGLVMMTVFLWLARRRGNIVPMRRRARVAATATLAR